MSEIKYMEKPEWVSWESISECLISGHEYNRKKGIYMTSINKTPDELREYLKGGWCFVAMDDGKVVGTCSLRVYKSNPWWAKGNDIAYTCLDAVVPGYRGTDVYWELNRIRDQYINEMGIRIKQSETHENNKLVQKINLKAGAKYVRFCAFPKTDYYSVVMVIWLDGCPFSDWYCNFRFKLSKFLTKLVFKRGRKIRFFSFN